jgi:hypothetical protein
MKNILVLVAKGSMDSAHQTIGNKDLKLTSTANSFLLLQSFKVEWSLEVKWSSPKHKLRLMLSIELDFLLVRT